MKSLVVLISIVAITTPTPAYYQYHGPPAPIGHDGRVLDTPEVAHAKAAHLAAVAEAAAKVPYGFASYSEDEDYHGYSKPVSVGHQMYHDVYEYQGPPAPLNHDGHVVDTPEVARAKAAHLAAYNHVASSAPLTGEDHSYDDEYDSSSHGHGYHGPNAPLSHDGRVVDTPEVAHARQNHLAAHANAYHHDHHDHHGHYDTY